ncbi:Lrp/AsnC family transcriptional regulator [Candidatus Neomarinimicrobiota bacterium]
MLDNIDKVLIEELQANARQTTSDLAQKVGLSVPAAAERIKKLQDNGVIKGYSALVDTKKVGKDVGVYISVISESSAHYDEVVKHAREEADIIECLSLTGEGSHLLVVQTENTSTLEALLSRIQAWPGVNRTEARVVLSHYKERGIIQVANSVIKQK